MEAPGATAAVIKSLLSYLYTDGYELECSGDEGRRKRVKTCDSGSDKDDARISTATGEAPLHGLRHDNPTEPQEQETGPGFAKQVDGDQRVEELKHHVRVYAAADYYQIDDLKDYAREKFQQDLEGHTATNTVEVVDLVGTHWYALKRECMTDLLTGLDFDA